MTDRPARLIRGGIAEPSSSRRCSSSGPAAHLPRQRVRPTGRARPNRHGLATSEPSARLWSRRDRGAVIAPMGAHGDSGRDTRRRGQAAGHRHRLELKLELEREQGHLTQPTGHGQNGPPNHPSGPGVPVCSNRVAAIPLLGATVTHPGVPKGRAPHRSQEERERAGRRSRNASSSGMAKDGKWGNVPANVRDRWSGRWDSNPRPAAWEAATLPLSYSRLGP